MDQQEWCDNQHLRMGLTEEMTYMIIANDALLAYQKFIEAKYKINVTLEIIPPEEILNWKTNEDLPQNPDVFMVATMINLMEGRISDKFKAFSFPIRLNPLLILSKPPTPQSASSMDFFNVDLYTGLFILLSLLFVSAFWSISTRLDISLKSSNAKSKTSFLSNSLDNFWNSFIIFFFEPYAFIPEILSVRILTGVWLLSVLILTVSLNCVMRTSFTFVTYEPVDSLKDLLNAKRILPKFVKGSLEERLINRKSKDNQDFQFLKDQISEDSFLSPIELANPDLYTQLKENEYLLLNYHTLLLVIGILILDDNFVNSIYISQPISEDYMAYPYRFNSSQCHKINHVFERVIMDLFETQWMKPVYLRNMNLMEKMKWRIPDSETKAIQLHDLFSVYLLFCYGIIISCVVITIELLTSVIKKRTRKATIRIRDRSIWN